jgi:hypothetical protein
MRLAKLGTSATRPNADPGPQGSCRPRQITAQFAIWQSRARVSPCADACSQHALRAAAPRQAALAACAVSQKWDSQ